MRGAGVIVVSLASALRPVSILLPMLSWSVQEMSDVMAPSSVTSLTQAAFYTSPNTQIRYTQAHRPVRPMTFSRRSGLDPLTISLTPPSHN